MATEMISLKLNSKFLKEVDKTVKEQNYQNRTEFIRASLRENIDKEALKKAYKELIHLKGSLKGKSKLTDEEFEKVREEAFEELSKERGWD